MPVAYEASRSSCASSAAPLRAETTHATAPGATPGAGTGGAGASSSSTCALVPLTPNADTPARRGRSPRGHGTGSVSSASGPADQSAFGVGSSTCRVGGSSSCRSACTIFTTPPTPAAAWAWPMLDFSEPSRSGRSAGRSAQ